MAAYWVCPERVFDGITLREGIALRIENGAVAELCAVTQIPKTAARFSIKGTLTPGFLDVQVNGGGGVLVNHTPTPEGMRAIAAAHRKFGTMALMPTVISDAPDIMEAAAHAAIALKNDPEILGLHIEGPHISPAQRGTHDAAFVRPLDETTLNIVTALCEQGVKTMITLAPEAATCAQISRLTAMGAVVSLGHTNASSQQMDQAFAAGATCVTHVFNAMSPMHHRSPGAVGAALNSQAFVGLICDGFHVDDAMIALALRARPVKDRMFLVSDAMPTVGGPDHFELYGKNIELKNGQLINDEGHLAGAHVTMAESVKRLVNVVGVSQETALKMALSVPADLLGRPELASLIGRPNRDVLILDDAYNLQGSLEEHFSGECPIFCV